MNFLFKASSFLKNKVASSSCSTGYFGFTGCYYTYIVESLVRSVSYLTSSTTLSVLSPSFQVSFKGSFSTFLFSNLSSLLFSTFASVSTVILLSTLTSFLISTFFMTSILLSISFYSNLALRLLVSACSKTVLGFSAFFVSLSSVFSVPNLDSTLLPITPAVETP